MIHPDTREQSTLADAAQTAYLTAHPHIDPTGIHNDLAAIEWRHGYITGTRKSTDRSSPERAEIARFGMFDAETPTKEESE